MENKEIEQFILADIWEEALQKSRECLLEAEVIQTAFNYLRIDKEKLKDALAYALSEWDI